MTFAWRSWLYKIRLYQFVVSFEVCTYIYILVRARYVSSYHMVFQFVHLNMKLAQYCGQTSLNWLWSISFSHYLVTIPRLLGFSWSSMSGQYFFFDLDIDLHMPGVRDMKHTWLEVAHECSWKLKRLLCSSCHLWSELRPNIYCQKKQLWRVYAWTIQPEYATIPGRLKCFYTTLGDIMSWSLTSLKIVIYTLVAQQYFISEGGFKIIYITMVLWFVYVGIQGIQCTYIQYYFCQHKSAATCISCIFIRTNSLYVIRNFDCWCFKDDSPLEIDF